MRRQNAVLFLMIAVLLVVIAACSKKSNKEETPVTITVWHVYGGQTDSPLNDLIDEFNQTEGKRAGINVQVTSVSNTNTIHDLVLASANQEPGSSPLPDLFISYPKTVLALPDKNILVDYQDYFSDDELSAFIPAFLEEGMIEDHLAILPVAKSTEIMFINKTIFERFTEATGITVDDLKTWEGLFEACKSYEKWTDSQTPDIADDGKNLFVHDYYFNYFQVGAESLGEHFFNGDQIAFGPTFKKIWDPLASAALSGGVWLKGGYATESIRTAESIVSVASSASILYYSDVVTYADNTTENVEIISRPCPVFADGEKMAMQRGAGFCTVRSTPEREKAAITFLKWLTEPQHNVDFVTKAGYMPVTEEAFADYLPRTITNFESKKYSSLYETLLKMQAEYQFYEAPQLKTYLDLETKFEENIRAQLELGKEDYLNADKKDEDLLKQISEERFIAFKDMMEK